MNNGGNSGISGNSGGAPPSLSTSHPRVLDFYARHPGVPFEQANLWLVEICESLFEKKARTESVAQMQSQLSLFTQSCAAQMEGLRGVLAALEDAAARNHGEAKAHLAAQLASQRRDCLADLKPVLDNQALCISEKCSHIADKNAASFGDKISLVILDQTPRLFQALKADLDVLALRKDKSLDDFASAFELKYCNMLKSLEPVYASIAALSAKNDLILRDLADFTAKFKSSSAKGKCSENLLSSVLHTMFPSGDVEDMTGVKASGDCILSRPHVAHRVMFENKNYERNVDKDEVEKFVRDVDALRTHAVLVSQKSGIAMKQNYQIEIHKGCVMVYIHHGEYSPEKLQIAVDIIDSMALRLAHLLLQDGAALHADGLGADHPDKHSLLLARDVLDRINDDYAHVVRQREAMALLLRDFHKKMAACIDDVRLPHLEDYLRPHYSIYAANKPHHPHASSTASPAETKEVCSHCNSYVANNKAALAAHRRGCLKKPPAKK